MALDIESLQKQLCTSFCADIKIVNIKNEFIIEMSFYSAAWKEK